MRKEQRRYKALNFDLDTNRLIAARDGASTSGAYRQIMAFLRKCGFERRQYSGYRSVQTFTDLDVLKIITDLYEAHPWLYVCVQRFDVTNIGGSYDLHDDIIKSRKAQERRGIDPDNELVEIA